MKKLYTNFLMTAFLLLPLGAVCYCQNYTPGKEWSDMSEGEVKSIGFSIDSLSKSWRFIKDETPVTGMMVVVSGKQLIYFGDLEEVSYLASVRKSILAMMYGKYVGNGTINLNTTLEDLEIDDIQGLSVSEKKATIKDLISARSGIYHPASNSGDDTRHAPKRGEKNSGEFFLYNNWDFNVAGFIFEKLTGKNIYKAFEEDLAIPLQMQDFDLSIQKKRGDRQQSKYLAYHFYLSTRDMARLGVLMANKGKWGEKQLIPSNWIDKITSSITPNSEMFPEMRKRGPFGYGYMWWVWDHAKAPKGFKGAYSAQGNYGQIIAVLPELDMVVVIKTKDVYLRTTTPLKAYEFLKMLVRSKVN